VNKKDLGPGDYLIADNVLLAINEEGKLVLADITDAELLYVPRKSRYGFLVIVKNGEKPFVDLDNKIEL